MWDVSIHLSNTENLLGFFSKPTHRILQQSEEALAGPGLQGTERAVSSGKRKSNRWAQRDHWLGRVSVGIRLEFHWKS